MTSVNNTNTGFTLPLRAAFGLIAIATLLEQRPWAQSSTLMAATAYAGTLMWAAMAAFGNKSGGLRYLTIGLALVYFALVVTKVAGFAT